MSADGIYYYPEEVGLKTRSLVNARTPNMYFHITLTGGSGTATATVEGSLDVDFANAIDITDLFGVSSLQVGAGESDQFLLGDDAAVPKLSAYRRVRIKVVLATGGANDADYQIELISH